MEMRKASRIVNDLQTTKLIIFKFYLCVCLCEVKWQQNKRTRYKFASQTIAIFYCFLSFLHIINIYVLNEMAGNSLYSLHVLE